MTFGERILVLRRRMKLTQQELGVLAGLHGNTIARLEQGDLNDLAGQAVGRLAHALNTTTDYLISGKEDDIHA